MRVALLDELGRVVNVALVQPGARWSAPVGLVAVTCPAEAGPGWVVDELDGWTAPARPADANVKDATAEKVDQLEARLAELERRTGFEPVKEA